jgi:hypothetical protein
LVSESKGTSELEHFDRRKEIVGRLYLWSEALQLVQSLIHLSNRARSGRSQPDTVHREKEYDKAFRGYIDATGQRPSLTALMKFNKLYPRAFPTSGECMQIERALQLLTVVVFGQIYKRGKRAEGRVAQNLDQTMAAILKEMKDHVVSMGVSEKDYNEITTKMKEMRDDQISHRVGAAANLRFGSRVSAHTMIEAGIENIDFKLLFDIASIMEEFIRQRINQIKSELDPHLSEFVQPKREDHEHGTDREG